MSSTQNQKSTISFVDFVPAELRENKRWEIVYYVLDPFTQKLKRKVNRVRPLQSITERRKLAKRMVLAINRKLERGWNPFINEKQSKAFVKFTDACEVFLSRTEKEVKAGDKRADTLRSYKSFINNICDYLVDINEGKMFVLKFNTELVRDFLDVVYYDRDNSARTRNNYLNFIKTLSEWFIRNGYLAKNPTHRIELVRAAKKVRTVFPEHILKEVFTAMETKNRSFYILNLVAYYCLIRRTELTKLRVRDVLLKNGIIYVTSETAKNKKNMPVTIPDVLMPFLAEHLQTAQLDDFLFSENYSSGNMKLKPKKISDEWSKLRKELKLPNKYQWYSLKDTGITNLLKAGVPLIAVRDQARHHSSIQTDAYTPREILVANQNIKSAQI